MTARTKGLTVRKTRARQKLIGVLEMLLAESDTEAGHYDADQALLDYINDPEIAVAYRALKKWYA